MAERLALEKDLFGDLLRAAYGKMSAQRAAGIELRAAGRRPAALAADPEWQAYVPKIRPLMITQETRVMKCAPFFVQRLKTMLGSVK